jgi:drug/metabolite transporter (DMT)-like permease
MKSKSMQANFLLLLTAAIWGEGFVAQRNAKPGHAAIILSLESVFSVFLGWLILGELLSPRIVLGCVLMLSGIMKSQIHSRESDKVD